MPHIVRYTSKDMDKAARDLLNSLSMEQRKELRDKIAFNMDAIDNAGDLLQQGALGTIYHLKDGRSFSVKFRPLERMDGGWFIISVYGILERAN